MNQRADEPSPSTASRPSSSQSTGWIDTPITPNMVRGAIELERTEHGLLPHRLPAWAREQCQDQQLAGVEAQSSGVRVVFRTSATALQLDTLRTRVGYRGVALRPDGVYDLLVDGQLSGQMSTSGGKVRRVDMATGSVDIEPGPIGTVEFSGLPSHVKNIEIWLPHTEITELVGLRTDHPVEAASEVERPVWLHHGSSISHGSNTDSPSATWPALAAAHGGAELINLGFGGAAMLDPFTARTLRDTPADFISVKIGINLVNADLMRMRAFGPAVHGFLDTIREGRPDTPLLVISPILCPMHEDVPGPSVPDLDQLKMGAMRVRADGDPADRAKGKLTLNSIREELVRIVEQRATSDRHLHYLDGRELYGEADAAELPLPDDLHPDAATHRRIGQRFAERIFIENGPFATVH